MASCDREVLVPKIQKQVNLQELSLTQLGKQIKVKSVKSFEEQNFTCLLKINIFLTRQQISEICKWREETWQLRFSQGDS